MSYSPPPLRVAAAVSSMLEGGVIACPTEAVWGLSCDPANHRAVTRLLELKRRPMTKGLILVASSLAQFEFLLADLDERQRDRLAATWPGPTTWLIPHHSRVSPWVHGEHDTVAVRVSAHPVVQALCRDWGVPVVYTSANPAGAKPPTTGWQVRRYFGDRLDGILPGAVGGAARPSEIKDLLSGSQIRA
jgi:L-threonylcarbamoyladenylate synthase